jgi:hypothetical protein
MKNRFGENVEFDERANEEGYFALKEHERIEEMKVDFQNAEAARKDGQSAAVQHARANSRSMLLWGLS